MEHITPLSDIPSSRFQLPQHPKINPISHTDTLNGYLQTDETTLQRTCKYYPKSPRFEGFEDTMLTLPGDYSYHCFNNFRKVLKAQKLLTGIFYIVQSWEERRGFYPAIKSFQNISSVMVSCDALSDSRMLKFFFISLIFLKKLKSLEFSFSFSFAFTQEKEKFACWKRFLKKIKAISHLSLSLTFELQSKFCYLDFNSFLSFLTKFTHLHALSLKISGAEELFSCAENLASILPTLKSLTKLTLDFSSSKTIQNSSLRRIFVSLHNLKALSSLELHIWDGFYSPIDSFSGCLDSLNHAQIQRLSFRFDGAYHNSKLADLSQALKNFTFLKHLQLHFSKCYHLTGEGMLEFFVVLKSLALLESLNLYFASQYQYERIVQYIASELGPLVKLKYLKLHISFDVYTFESETQQFFSNLKDLKSLTFLQLSLDSANIITDNTLEALSQSLNELVMLEILHLHFRKTSRITNQGMEALSCAVQHLEKLSSLILVFDDLYQVNETAITKIGGAMQKLEHLSSVTLSIQGLSNVNTLANFFTVLREIKDQVKMKVYLPKLAKNFKEVEELSRLKHINLYFI